MLEKSGELLWINFMIIYDHLFCIWYTPYDFADPWFLTLGQETQNAAFTAAAFRQQTSSGENSWPSGMWKLAWWQSRKHRQNPTPSILAWWRAAGKKQCIRISLKYQKVLGDCMNSGFCVPQYQCFFTAAPVGWNCTNSKSCIGRPARDAMALPSPAVDCGIN